MQAIKIRILMIGWMLLSAAAFFVLWTAPVEAMFTRCSDLCSENTACNTACTYTDDIATTCDAAGYACNRDGGEDGGSEDGRSCGEAKWICVRNYLYYVVPVDTGTGCWEDWYGQGGCSQ